MNLPDNSWVAISKHYFAKAVPRVWLASGKPIRISQAPTRWGRASLEMCLWLPAK
jgi:hypothetical protein